MNIDFRIPVFVLNGDGVLVKKEDRIFKITFIQGTQWNRVRICVDGKLSNQSISFLSYDTSKKDKYLSAIQYVLHSGKVLNTPSKFLTEQKVLSIYNKGVVKSMKTNLLNTQTEQSRDILSTYNLVFIE